MGTAVFVNHRMVGRLGKEWWVTPSPLDTVATKDGRSALVSYGRTRPDSDYTAALSAMVRPSGRAKLVFVGPSGAKLETVCELGESTDVDISCAGHWCEWYRRGAPVSRHLAQWRKATRQTIEPRLRP